MNTVLRIVRANEQDKTRGHWFARTQDAVRAIVHDMRLTYSANVDASASDTVVISALGDRQVEMEELGLLYLNPHSFNYTVSVE